MRCPKCRFVSSDKKDVCPSCLVDLRPYKHIAGLAISNSKASLAELIREHNAEMEVAKSKKPQPSASISESKNLVQRATTPKGEPAKSQTAPAEAPREVVRSNPRPPEASPVKVATTKTSTAPQPTPASATKTTDPSVERAAAPTQKLREQQTSAPVKNVAAIPERSDPLNLDVDLFSPTHEQVKESAESIFDQADNPIPIDLGSADSFELRPGPIKSEPIKVARVSGDKLPALEDQELDLLFSQVNQAKPLEIPRSTATPPVMEFNEDDEQFQRALDEMIGDEKIDVAAVKIETPKINIPSGTTLVSDDVEISFEFEMEGGEIDANPDDESSSEDQEDLAGDEEHSHTSTQSSQTPNTQQEAPATSGVSLEDLLALMSAEEQHVSAPPDPISEANRPTEIEPTPDATSTEDFDVQDGDSDELSDEDLSMVFNLEDGVDIVSEDSDNTSDCLQIGQDLEDFSITVESSETLLTEELSSDQTNPDEETFENEAAQDHGDDSATQDNVFSSDTTELSQSLTYLPPEIELAQLTLESVVDDELTSGDEPSDAMGVRVQASEPTPPQITPSTPTPLDLEQEEDIGAASTSTAGQNDSVEESSTSNQATTETSRDGSRNLDSILGALATMYGVRSEEIAAKLKELSLLPAQGLSREAAAEPSADLGDSNELGSFREVSDTEFHFGQTPSIDALEPSSSSGDSPPLDEIFPDIQIVTLDDNTALDTVPQANSVEHTQFLVSDLNSELSTAASLFELEPETSQPNSELSVNNTDGDGIMEFGARGPAPRTITELNDLASTAPIPENNTATYNSSTNVTAVVNELDYSSSEPTSDGDNEQAEAEPAEEILSMELSEQSPSSQLESDPSVIPDELSLSELAELAFAEFAVDSADDDLEISSVEDGIEDINVEEPITESSNADENDRQRLAAHEEPAPRSSTLSSAALWISAEEELLQICSKIVNSSDELELSHLELAGFRPTERHTALFDAAERFLTETVRLPELSNPISTEAKQIDNADLEAALKQFTTAEKIVRTRSQQTATTTPQNLNAPSSQPSFIPIPASRPRRFVGWVFDVFVVNILTVAIWFVSFLPQGPRDAVFALQIPSLHSVLPALGLLIATGLSTWIAVMTLTITSRGQSPGQRLVGVSVVSNDGALPTVEQGLARALLQIADLLLLGLFSLFAVGRGRSTLIDRLANTVAVDTSSL